MAKIRNESRDTAANSTEMNNYMNNFMPTIDMKQSYKTEMAKTDLKKEGKSEQIRNK